MRRRSPDRFTFDEPSERAALMRALPEENPVRAENHIDVV
jgi:hypothetical protein